MPHYRAAPPVRPIHVGRQLAKEQFMVGHERSEPTPLQLYDIIRSKYAHEDLWIQQRVGWLLTANGFVFAGYGALFGLYSGARADIAVVVWRSILLLSWVGVGLAFLVGFGVLGAYSAKKGAEKEWERLVAAESRQHFPAIDASAGLKWLGSLTSGVLCTGLFFAWLCIIFFVLP
jgi:hypothetical protein